MNSICFAEKVLEALPGAACPHPGDFEICGIRMADGAGRSAPEANFVWLVRDASAPPASVNSAQAMFALPGSLPPNEQERLKGGAPCLFLPPEMSMEEAFNALSGVLERHSALCMQCMERIAAGCSIGEVLDACSAFLANPVALFSASLELIHWSGSFQKDIAGTVWERAFEMGFIDIDIYTPEEKRVLTKHLNSGEAVYEFNAADDPRHVHMCAPIALNGSVCGILAQINLNSPFTEAQKRFLLLVRRYVELAFSSGNAFPSSGEYAYTLIRMIEGQDVDDRIIGHWLSQNRWKSDDCYALASLVPEGEPDRLLSAARFREVRWEFPDCAVFEHEGSILVLHRAQDDGGISAFSARLAALAERLPMSCGLSSPFYSFRNLRCASIQSKIAASFCERAGTVSRFEAHYTQLLARSLGRAENLKALCHPMVLRLLEDSTEYSRELVRNLKVYLLCGCSISAAAKRLFLHRNSFLYRLQKLREIFGTDFTSQSQDERLYLLVSCILAEEIAPPPEGEG